MCCSLTLRLSDHHATKTYRVTLHQRTVTLSLNRHFLPPGLLLRHEVQTLLLNQIKALKSKEVKHHGRPPSRQSSAALCLNPSSVTAWQTRLTFAAAQHAHNCVYDTTATRTSCFGCFCFHKRLNEGSDISLIHIRTRMALSRTCSSAKAQSSWMNSL